MVQSVRSNNAQLASSALKQKGRHPPMSCLVVCMTHQAFAERVIQSLPGRESATWLAIHGPPASLARLLIHTAPSISFLSLFQDPPTLLHASATNTYGCSHGPCPQGYAGTNVVSQVKTHDVGIPGMVLSRVKTGFISKHPLICKTEAKKELA